MMTKRTIYESDLSGESHAIATRVGFDNAWYEVDLTGEEQDTLKAVLEPYFAVGHRVVETARKRQVPDTTPEEREEIRAWALKQGFEFADRGRIPKRIMAAYDKAHALDRAA